MGPSGEEPLRGATPPHEEVARLALSKTVSARASGSFDDAIVRLLRLSADTIGVERAGIWLFDEGRRNLHALTIHTRSLPAFGPDEPISMAGRDAYLASLEEHRAVAADDALIDPRTASLGEYLVKRRISSLLDAGIFRGGHLVGVVCHEHVGAPRAWTDFERSFSSSVADVTALLMEELDRGAAESALQTASLELQRKAELADLAAHVAHDFNNYLTIIRLQVGLASRSPDLAPQVVSALGHAARAAEGASALAQQLLGVARRERQSAETVDVTALVRDGAPLWEALAGRSPVRLELADEPLIAAVDRSGLERALLNLVANARDASTGGETITIGARRAGADAVVIEVRDEGAGMDEITRRRVIEPYFTTKQAGTGLGLAAAVGIVRQVRGELEVISAPGAGTTVRLVLPVTASEAPPPP